MGYGTGGYRNDPAALRGVAPSSFRREGNPVDFENAFARGLILHPGKTLEQALAALALTARPSGLDVFQVDNGEFPVAGVQSGALIRGIHLANFGHADTGCAANSRTVVAASTGPFSSIKLGDIVIPGRFPGPGFADDLIWMGFEVAGAGSLGFEYYNPTAGVLQTGAFSIPCLVINLTD